MKKVMVILLGVFLAGSFTVANAAVLSDSQLAGISAGDFDTDINDDVTAVNSAVSSQKNIGVVASTDGAVTNATISNINGATVDNTGDSAISLQANIGAVAGLGTVAPSEGNTISNTNTATVTNNVFAAGNADLSLEGTSNSGDAGINSMLSTVSASQSAVATQNNIGSIVGAGGVSGASINNSNSATVTNTGL